MQDAIPFADFRKVFLHNSTARSRTAAGESATGVSSTKKKLLLEGETLKTQVLANTERLIVSVWNARAFPPERLTPPVLRFLSEHWYDIINFGLQYPDAYEFWQYADIAAGGTLDEPLVRLNPRYRTWMTHYHDANPWPALIEHEMEQFYGLLYAMFLRDRIYDEASLLGFVDHRLDMAIHPWADSCGRHATTMVMWLALLFAGKGWKLPVFGTRDEHHAAMKHLPTHIAYYEECLKRELP